MFTGPQGMSLTGNAAAAASVAATSAATAAAVAVVSCYCSINIFKGALKAEYNLHLKYCTSIV